MEAWVSIIGSLGFPIAASIGMFWLLKKETENHKDESQKWVKALDNNTATIDKLIEYLQTK